MRGLIRDECGVDTQQQRYIIRGAQDVPGFDAVAAGGKVNVEKVTPGMVKLCKDILAQHPDIRGFLFECTELPAYSDAVRFHTGKPVYDVSLAATSSSQAIWIMRDLASTTSNKNGTKSRRSTILIKIKKCK